MGSRNVFASFRKQVVVANQKKPNGDQNALDRMRLSTEKRLVPKTFKPWVFKGVKTEDEALDFLRAAAETGDPDADILLNLLKYVSMEDLIVEGIIRVEN